jgi:hypothetical protein
MSDKQYAISLHHIPVRGGLGVGVIVAFLVALMINELPQLRWPVIGGAAAGLLLGVALIVWRELAARRRSPVPPHRSTTSYT